MEGGSTRERTLAAALELFGRKGYDGVSLGDIAQAVGIKAPSLYKHFESKEALFAAVTPAVSGHYHTLWAEVDAAQRQLERDIHVLGSFSAERLESETLAWVNRELDVGCNHRAFANQCPQGVRWLWDEPLALYEGFFARLIEAQSMRRGDAHVMAVEYLAPIVHLMALADRDESRQRAVTEEVRKHVRQFHRVFAVRERPTPGSVARGFFRR